MEYDTEPGYDKTRKTLVKTYTKHWYINTLRLAWNGQHFAVNIFKHIFSNENVWILCNFFFLLKFVSKGQVNNIPSLIQIMAWWCTGNYTIVSFLRAPRWNIGPTAMPRAAGTANSARAKRGRYWPCRPPEALQEGRYSSVGARTKWHYYHYYHLHT